MGINRRWSMVEYGIVTWALPDSPYLREGIIAPDQYVFVAADESANDGDLINLLNSLAKSGWEAVSHAGLAGDRHFSVLMRRHG
jgi:hypothetical protein